MGAPANGRKAPGRAKISARVNTTTSLTLNRAGFEPCVCAALPSGLSFWLALQQIEVVHARRGSNPARINAPRMARARRAEIFALPGRDTGPTNHLSPITSHLSH
jgi:hypothetical protein